MDKDQKLRKSGKTTMIQYLKFFLKQAENGGLAPPPPPIEYIKPELLQEMIDHLEELEKPVEQSQPMDNNKQAVDITGYRVLSQAEKDQMNKLKELEKQVLQTLSDTMGEPGTNIRSLSIAKTNIQTGFMWAIRAIARPNGE